MEAESATAESSTEDKEATEPGHLIVNEKEKLENSSHVSSDEIPKSSEPGNKQENKVMEKKEDFLEVQPNKDKHDIREEQNNIPANQVSKEETIHDQENVDSRKALEKYVQEGKEAMGSTNTLSISESYKKTNSALEANVTENFEEVSNFLKDKDQIQEALEKDVQEEKAGNRSTNTLPILESYKKTDSPLEAKETENSEEESNFLKDKDQIQDEFDKDVADPREIKYDLQEAPKVNTEILKENEAATGAEHNKLEMLEDEEDANRRDEAHDDSCNSSSHSILNKASKQEDTETDPKTRIEEIVDEAVNQEKFEGKVKDGSEYNQFDNFDGVPEVNEISKRISKPRKETVNKDEMILEIKQRLQEVTEEIDQDLSVMNQKNSGKEATELGKLTMNVEEEHEESSCVSLDENIPKPSKPSNNQEKEALERKDGFLEEDQRIKDKDKTKEEQNLIQVNEVLEDAIIQDQGAEDSGNELETKFREEEKVDTEGSITPFISESNKETDSAIGEKETEDSEEVSNLMKDKDQIQDEFHKDSVDTHVSKYDVQGTLETKAEESLTGNEAVTGTENNDLGMLEDEKDANKRAKVHDDSCNGSSNDILNEASKHEETESILEQKKVESVEEGIKQKDDGENNLVDNFDVLANISIISQQNVETQKKIVGKDETVLEMKERLQEATEEIDQELSIMKQKNEGKEATESGQSTMNVEEEHEESSCVASDENIPKPSKLSNEQEKEAVERKDGFLEEDQQTKDKDEIKEEQNLILVNEVSEEAIIHEQRAEDSGKGLETKVREEEKVDTESSIMPPISESNKETDSTTGEKETEDSEEVSNLLKDKDQIQDEFHKDSVDTHGAKYDVQGTLETNAEESLAGNEAVTGTENNDLGMLEDENDANKRAKIHDGSYNGSSNGLLNKASEHEDTERVLEQKKVESIEEAIKQEKFYLVNIQDGGESNQVHNFDVLSNISKISQQILESQEKIVGKDETVLEMKEILQEATDEIDQDLSVMKQKNEGKEATELGRLTMNLEEEHEESSCVASDENIPKQTKPKNKQENEALERKDGFLEKDQQNKDKDKTKEAQNLVPVNEVLEDAIIHDQGAEDSGNELETKVREEEKVDRDGNITPFISESSKETNSAIGEKETENSKKVSNFLKDKDQIQDEFHKDAVGTHVLQYDVQEALETNAEESLTGNEAVTGTENNDLELLEDEKDANKRAEVHDDSCNGSSNDILNEASRHKDTESVLEQKKVENIEEGNKQEDGGESNLVDNFDVLASISIISQKNLESQKKIVGKDETFLEMKERLQEATEEIDQELSVMKQENEGKEATESGQSTMNVEEHEESSCVASDENIPKPSKPSSKQEKEELERKDGFLKEDQQTKDKNGTKEEQNLIPVNAVSEEAIIHDQGAEDLGKGLETKVREEEKVDTEGGIIPSISESNKEIDSATREKETEDSEKVSNLLKDRDQIQDDFHKDSVDTHVSKYDVQGTLETNAEESWTGNEAVTGTENNDLGMLEDENDANKRAKIHDDSCNGSSNSLLNKASEHEDKERVLEQKKVESVEEAIKQEKFYLVNIQDGGESNQVNNFDVLSNISIISQQILEYPEKIVGKDETVLEMKERFQEATDEIDQDLSVMKQKNEEKEATELGRLTMNVEGEQEESSCEPSKPSNKQEKEALERKDGFLEEDQQIKDKDKIKEEQNLIPVNEVLEDAIIHDQGAEDSGNELATKVRGEEKVDTEGNITPFISESNKETD